MRKCFQTVVYTVQPTGSKVCGFELLHIFILPACDLGQVERVGAVLVNLLPKFVNSCNGLLKYPDHVSIACV